MKTSMKIVKRTIIILSAVIAVILLGYFLRIDRFGMAKISWIDCLKINNTMYSGNFERTLVDAASLGEEMGKVKFNVSQNVNNPSYRFRNGDAAFLEVGTKIYSVKSDTEAIAVKVGEDYFLYKADRGK